MQKRRYHVQVDHPRARGIKSCRRWCRYVTNRPRARDVSKILYGQYMRTSWRLTILIGRPQRQFMFESPARWIERVSYLRSACPPGVHVSGFGNAIPPCHPLPSLRSPFSNSSILSLERNRNRLSSEIRRLRDGDGVMRIYPYELVRSLRLNRSDRITTNVHVHPCESYPKIFKSLPNRMSTFLQRLCVIS